MNDRVSSRRTHLSGVKVSSVLLAVSIVFLYSLGILVTDATDPAAYGSPASIIWGVSGCVMLIAWSSLMWFVSQIWATRPGEKSLAILTCGLFAYAIPALVLAMYLFGTGIAVGPRPAPIEMASKLLGLTGLGAFVVGCFVVSPLILRSQGGSDKTPK